MGSSQGKESGIQDYQLWTLIGYIVQTYEDALAKRRSYDDAQNVIIFHLKELSRYALNPKKSPNPDNIYFNGQPQLTIHEKYRHSDGQHAWSLTIQLNPNLRLFKVIHGTPTTRDSSVPASRQEARQDGSVTETLQGANQPIYSKSPPTHSMNTQQTVYPPPGSYSRTSARPARPSQPNPSNQPSQPRTNNTLPVASTPRDSFAVRSPVDSRGPPVARSHPSSHIQTKNRTALPNHPALPVDYTGDFDGTQQLGSAYENLASGNRGGPGMDGMARMAGMANMGGNHRMPIIENDQIAQNFGDINRSNHLTDTSHIPANDEEFNLNRFS
jgi:hypothetical protein